MIRTLLLRYVGGDQDTAIARGGGLLLMKSTECCVVQFVPTDFKVPFLTIERIGCEIVESFHGFE